MKIAIASDHAGFQAKTEIISFLNGMGYETADFGTFSTDSCDYPDYAFKAATAVANGEFERGVLICSSGVGVSIAANKVKGIRCALCTDDFCAEYSRKHNDAQMIAMGAKVISVEKMKSLVTIFLNTQFEGGRHLGRVKKIADIESGKDPSSNDNIQ